jgi:hypothetical protein
MAQLEDENSGRRDGSADLVINERAGKMKPFNESAKPTAENSPGWSERSERNPGYRSLT